MRTIPIIFSTSVLFLTLNLLNAQGPATPDELPRVFILGEHQVQYEEMLGAYETSLLEVCELDVNRAFEVWMSMIQELEAYADQIDYDINGVRVWFHVFFDTDGSVDHLAYHLKPQSRNVDQEEFTAFLKSFINLYKVPLITDTPYFNYTSVAFPSYYQPLGGEGN